MPGSKLELLSVPWGSGDGFRLGFGFQNSLLQWFRLGVHCNWAYAAPLNDGGSYLCASKEEMCADLLSDSLQMLLFCVSESQERDKETASPCN